MSDDSPGIRQGEPSGSAPGRNLATPSGGGPDGQRGDDGVVVVGGGAAGLAAAAAVRAAGVPVTLVSEGPLGGDCTWHGCVPTKSLIEAAAAGADARAALVHARAVVARVARGESEHALASVGVGVVRARATLGAGPTLRLPDGVLRPGRGVVLATGSRPTPLDGLPVGEDVDGRLVCDTDGWLDGLDEHLARGGDGVGRDGGGRDVVVVGGGPSGAELAQALARLRAAGPGGTVTLLERGPDLLPGLPGAGPVMAASLRADGVRVATGADGARVRAAVAGAGLVLLAAGRSPVLDVLGPGAGVLVRDGAVVVDAAMATSAPRVGAAGDVVGLSPSTHVAVATGRVAAAGLLAGPGEAPPAFDPTWVPRVVWTDPQVAAVGRAPGPPGARTVRVPLSRNDRAPAAAVPGRPDRARGGFAQVWAEGEEGGGRLVGAVVVGPGAAETVAEVALVGRLGLTAEEWVGGRVGLGGLSAHHAYPAWSWTWALVADRLLAR